jgi:hypothetical protein
MARKGRNFIGLGECCLCAMLVLDVIQNKNNSFFLSLFFSKKKDSADNSI